MSLKLAKTHIFFCGLISCFLSSCFHPPYNNFKPVHPLPKRIASGAAVGTIVGAAATGTVAGALTGTVVGGTVGTIVGMNKSGRRSIIKELNKENIEFVQYGDTMTLIVPVDKYFMFESPRLNEICFPGLNNIVRLLKFYPLSPIYVAGFTDNVGTARHKKRMSQAQAETMLTFLWAHNIPAQLLKAEGYGDKNDVGDNKLIHGSAFNRRIEIQWFNNYGKKICANCRVPVLPSAVYATK
ncbi:MAG: OmpA family protein [Legionella longbeachae]|nr:OmpA family protein [Legionella longbeachae]